MYCRWSSSSYWKKISLTSIMMLKVLEKNLQRATKVADQTGGGILVISEGCFWYERRAR